MPRYHARSLAGVPFNYGGLFVSCEGNDIELSEYDASRLAQVRCVEVRDQHGTLVPRVAGMQRPRMRVRLRAGLSNSVVAGGHRFGTDVYVVDEDPALSAHPSLDVRPHDDALFPSPIEVRARLRQGHAYPRAASIALREDWGAYSVDFDEVTKLRFCDAVDIEFLDKRDEPPLARVVIDGYRTGPFTHYGLNPPLDAENAAMLYPREIERLQAFPELRLHVEATPPTSPCARTAAGEADTVLTSLATDVDEGLFDRAMDTVDKSREPIASAVIASASAFIMSAPDPIGAGDAVDAPGRPDPHIEGAGDGDAPVRDLRSALERWTRDPETRRAAFASDGLTVFEIAEQALGLRADDVTRSLQMQIGSVLRDLGWEHLPLCWRGKRRVRPYRPQLG